MSDLCDVLVQWSVTERCDEWVQWYVSDLWVQWSVSVGPVIRD